MESQSSLVPEMFAVLERGGTILTGNQRAARTLRLAYDRGCRRRGLAYWPPPAIMAWETWTGRLWQHLLLAGKADRMLLNSSQELSVWRSVILADPRHAGLQTVDSLATMASAAWKLLCAYQGQSKLRSLGVSEDTRTFQRWAQSFNLRCTSDLYLSQSELERVLAEHLASLPSADLLLVGFDSMTPAQAALVEAMGNAGSMIEELPPARSAEQRSLRAAETADDELIQAAGEIQSLLEENANVRLAIIHPDVASERNEIDRVFRKILAPELNSVTNHQAGPYEFSLGLPLSQSAMVASALDVLRLATSSLLIGDLSRLLLSPWFSPASELNLRAAFDAHDLRTATLLHPQMSLGAVIHAAESLRTRTGQLGNLLHQLHALHRTVERAIPDPARQKPFADWADSMRDLLRAAGWSTFTLATSVEFQTRSKWESALDELATLDFEGIRPTFTEAFTQLEGILDRTLFAPESRDALVQIMSPQEAAGSRFDAIFFLRCSDLAWPPALGTNPLLGWKLQRDLGMPGSDPALDAARSAVVTRRLVSSTPQIVFSYTRQTEDSQQRPSPLLSGLELEPAMLLDPATEFSPVLLEEFPDPGYIPLSASKVRGGSAILKNQAACGFRAFAEARLASRPLDRIDAGLDPGERGSLAHDTMAYLWQELQTQAALRSLTLVERRATVDRAITRALDRISNPAHFAGSTWDPAYLDIQRERLHRIVGTWLQLELERAPFAIKALEEKFANLSIGPLTLDLRIDRVDTLLDEEGNPAGEVLLDYKTGDAVPKHWQGDRPDDPQLPLYAALSKPGMLAGVGFVRLRPGTGIGLAGYASEPGQLLSATVPASGSLETQIEEWRRILTTLAEDFAAGDATVRPKQYPNTCTYCVQRILCRVDPELLEGAENEEEDEASIISSGDVHG